MDIKTYVPNKFIKAGIRIWPEMIGELIEYRELIHRLFIRNLSAKYKQAVLGYAWVLIMPFIAIGSFLYLQRLGVVNIGVTDVPYPLFALIGLSVWQLFSSGLNSGCNSLVESGNLMSKINFPREVLILSSMASSVFEFTVKCILIFISFFIFKFVPQWTILLFPLALLPIILLTIGLSFILSLVNGVLRDTANMISLLTTFLMLLTPVLYPVTDDSILFFKLNPLTSLVNGPRDLIIYGTIREPMDFIWVSIMSLLIFLVSWRIFHMVETKIPERL